MRLGWGYLDELVCVVILRHGAVLWTDEVCLAGLTQLTDTTRFSLTFTQLRSCSPGLDQGSCI